MREEVLSNLPNSAVIIPILQKTTENIHAAWLFVNIKESQLILHTLSNYLSSRPINDQGGWYNFGGRLNIDWRSIDVSKILYINHNCSYKIVLVYSNYNLKA